MSPQAAWVLQEEVAPLLRNSIPRTTSYVGAEDHEELVQDGIAIAVHLMHNAELAGKPVTPGNIAYYAAQHIRAGRRSTGSSRLDIMGTQTQLSGRTRLHSLNEVVSDKDDANEIAELQDLLSLDAEDPSMTAARNLDWQAMMARLTEREQAIVVASDRGRDGFGFGGGAQIEPLHVTDGEEPACGDGSGIHGRGHPDRGAADTGMEGWDQCTQGDDGVPARPTELNTAGVRVNPGA